MASKKKPAKKSALPKGFKPLGGFGETWPGEAKKGAVIQGTLAAVDSTTQTRKDGKKTKKVTVRIARIETNDGKSYSVWESAGTKPLMDVEVGSKVYIEYMGFGVAKKGQNAPRLYNIAVKE